MVPMMTKIAMLVAVLLTFAVGAPALADNATAIRQLQSLRQVNYVNVIDTGATADRWVFAKRAMHSNTPLTPLQVAIVSNPVLMSAVRATTWNFDLKSIYAARIEGYSVYLYMGSPPNQ